MIRFFFKETKKVLKPLYRTIRESFFRQKFDRAKNRWIRKHSEAESFIDKDLSLTGREDSFSYIKLNDRVYIEKDVTIWTAPYEETDPILSIGQESYIGRNVFFNVYYPITIGSLVQIGPYCYLTSANHGYSRRDVPIKHQDFTGAPIVIEDDVWIGTHAVILPGVTVGKGAIVGAGSIVNKNIPAYEIWGGVPAKFIKVRPS